MAKQATLSSFFGKKAAAKKAEVKNSTTPTETKAEGNLKNDDDSVSRSKITESEDLDLVDTDDEVIACTKATDDESTIKPKNKKLAMVKSERQNIVEKQNSKLEDSSDDDDFEIDGEEKDLEETSENEDEEFKIDGEEKDLEETSANEDEEFNEPLITLKKRKRGTGTTTETAPKKVTSSSMASNSKVKSKSEKTFASILSDAELTSENGSWKDGAPMNYSILCKTLSEVEAITSRLDIASYLTSLFRLCLIKNPDDLITLVYLASNAVAPAYQCVELGIGDAILIKAVGEANGSNPSIIKKKYEVDGDLGTVAMTAKGKQRTLGFGMKPKPLLAKEVLSVFRQIATTTGSKSQKWKVDKIKGLLVRAQDVAESKYIIRGLQGKLRIGLAQSTVLISLSHAIFLSGPLTQSTMHETNDILSEDAKNVSNEKLNLGLRLEAAVNIVKKAYSEVPSFDALVSALLIVPLSHLHKECTLRPGLPVEPMLAKPTKSIQEVLKRLSGKRFTCEFKYDGERAQVHLNRNGETNVFSRSLLDTSQKFPEVPLYVKEACVDSKVDSFVLDTEVVAYNRETQQFVPFQILSTRKKAEESEENAKVKVIIQAFDLMYLNGESLLDRTLSDRREIMKKNFKAIDGKFQFATALDATENGDTALLEEFLDTAVKGQCEGLMVKTLDENASYQPSYRSLNWLKLKKDYLEGLGDSVDLVPIGAYYGKGKRTGVYGAYLLACYDEDTEEYQSVCKIGTGFSDDDLRALSESLNNNRMIEKSTQYNVSSTLDCNVWFEACQVWEVKAADLSKSSTHKGAVDKTGESGRGIGLRFPRFERVRSDKRPDQATTSDQILDMFYAQDSIFDKGYANDGI